MKQLNLDSLDSRDPEFDHCLTRICDCGGQALMWRDCQVDDYYACCSMCHLSTIATYDLDRVIKDWNNNTNLYKDDSLYWMPEIEDIENEAIKKMDRRQH